MTFIENLKTFLASPLLLPLHPYMWVGIGALCSFIIMSFVVFRWKIKSLSKKDYSSLKGIRSLDFVLMFVPIDQAFSSAVQDEEKLISEMYAQKVIIVTPTTLLATLKMIAYFWRHEHQSRNAVEIAERAGSLYDKLRGFVKDMEKLGSQIDSCQESYEKAINKLSTGRGNLISQAARFPELGVKVKEELGSQIIDP